MIPFYDKDGNYSPITVYDDLCIVKNLDGFEDALSFTVDTHLDQYSQIEEECRIVYDGNNWLVKKIKDDSFECHIDFDFLKEELFVDYYSNSVTVDVLLETLLPGWTVTGDSIPTGKHTLSLDFATKYDILEQAMATYDVYFTWQTEKKIVTIHSADEDISTGVYITDELNLRSISYCGETTDFATRLYPYGSDGMTIADVNDGKEYVENHTYSDKVVCAYWSDERYTVAENLMADAQAKLDEMAYPVRSYECDVVDLAKTSGSKYSFLDFQVHKTVTLIDRLHNVRVDHKIVEYKMYPDAMEDNTVTLSTVVQDVNDALASTAESIEDTVDATIEEQAAEAAVKYASAYIESLTARIATIEEAYIDTAYVSKVLADYATVSDFTAYKAEITELTASYLTADNAKLTYATISDLTVATADIDTLTADVANLNTVLAGNIGTGTLQTVHLTADNVVIDDAIITSAMIADLSASKLTAGTIYTDKVTIQSESGNLYITDNTIQIQDGTTVRVQIGEDASGDYNLYLWDAAGNLLWDAGGLYAAGIHDGIIKDVAIADDANINESKIDMASVAERLNEDGSLVVDAAQVTIDNTTLDYKLTTITDNTDAAQAAAEAAQAAAVAAQSTADDAASAAATAASDAATAQSAADAAATAASTAASNAAAAQSTADSAATAAANAQATADAAASDLTQAQADLKTAQDNYAALAAQANATDEELAAAQQAITDAQSAVDTAQATADAASKAAATAQTAADTAQANADAAQSAADAAQADAEAAQSTADTAKANAATAQAAAEAAQSTADDAAAAAAELETRTTTLETELSVVQGQITAKVWQTDITEAISGISIGGRNLVFNSDFSDGTTKWNNWGSPTTRELVTDSQGKIWAHIVGTGAALYQGYSQNYSINYLPLEGGSEYTFSCKVKGGSSGQIFTVGIHWDNASGSILSQSWKTFTVGTDWEIVSTTFTSNASAVYFNIMIGVSDKTTSYEVYYTDVKLEKGNVATDWSPAPEDTETAITTIQDQYTVVTQTINGIETEVGDLTTVVTDNYETLSNQITAVETTASGISATVSDLQTTVTENYTDLSSKITTVSETADSISATVSSNYTALSAADTKYGTCSTAASTKAKVVTCSSFTTLAAGATICVYFTYANTATSPTLNVNSTGAKSIYAYGAAIASDSDYNWVAKSYVTFVYNGSQWCMVDAGSHSKIAALQVTADSITASVSSVETRIDTAEEAVAGTVAGVEVQYALGTSSTTAPTSGWSATAPDWEDGKYMWQKTVTTFVDGSTAESDATCITGATGATGSTGADGADGERGTSILKVTTAPSSYTTTTGGYTPTYRIALSTVTSQASVDEVLVGDSILYSYYVYPVGYVDSSYVYLGARTSIRGAQGATGAAGADGADGADGVGISSITEYYAVSSSNSTAPTSWSTSVQTMTTTNKYLWNYEVITYTDDTTSSTSKRVIGVYGNTGSTGATGATGASGSDGNGISSITNYYLRSSSSSGVTTSTSGWTTTIQTITTTYKYLWNYEVVAYTDGTSYTSTPCIIGVYGNTGATGATGAAGADGADGADGERGTSILKVTTAPSGYTTTTGGYTPTYRIALSTVTSQASVDEVLVGDSILYSYYIYPVGYVDSSYVYLGARVSIRGATGATGAAGADGADGADGVGISSVVPQYYLSKSSTSCTGGSWSTTMPDWVDGYYIWTRSYITWDDGTTSTTTATLAGAINTANEAAAEAQATATETKAELEILSDTIALCVTTDADTGYLRLGAGSDGTVKFTVDTDNLTIDEDGNVSMAGKVTATSGTIGGWTITSQRLYSEVTIDDIDYRYYLTAATGDETSTYSVIGIYNITDATWPYRVYYTGETVCTGLTDKGDLTCSGNGAFSGSLSTYGYTVPRILYGTDAETISATSGSYSVTFSKAFAGSPKVIVAPRHSSSTTITARVYSVSTTGFTYRFTSGATGGTVYFDWIAMY